MDGAQPALLTPAAATAATECSPEEEIRFAVVMYGGVSLAIYINGIAQELLNMVYATAPRTPDDSTALRSAAELTGSQAVYRKLGQCLQAWREGDEDVRRLLRESAAGPQEQRERAAREIAARAITTRFIVDILSGTSAGGINAIFLAKALANQQSIEGLKALWVSEGDLAKLINDQTSCEGLAGWSVAEPQASLLNSQRMYRKLLEAFDQMEPTRQPPRDSPLVGELDLFVTTTDIQGLPLPVKLADSVVYEKRHRNVFHFRYAGARTGQERVNDFTKANDPFLAFSARCTSSFPFAFEPMRLADIEAVTQKYDRGENHEYRRAMADDPAWQKFYSEYWRLALIDLKSRQRHGRSAEAEGAPEEWLAREQKKLKADFRVRAFGDGGYLDNKPFSYATSMLMRRRASVPVQRKLIYIEPSPEHPERDAAKSERPDFAENIRAALLELPTKETIREDIERVLERNRLLARVSIYTREVDADVARLCGAAAARRSEGDVSPCDERSIRRVEDFSSRTLSDMIALRGIAYGAYHRLRVDAVTTMLASLIARAAQHDPRSDVTVAVKALVEAWRLTEYEADTEPGTPHKTENRFLAEFDLHFHMRRLAFLSRRINELSRCDQKARDLLNTWMHQRASDGKKQIDVLTLSEDKAWRDGFRKGLRDLKKALNEHVGSVAACEEALGRVDNDGRTPLTRFVDKLRMRWEDLERVLNKPATERVAAAREVLEVAYSGRADALGELVGYVRERFAERRRLELNDGDDLSDGETVAHACMAFYYSQYHVYDMILFPVQYGTGSSESSEVEIFRISPEDATSIIDERNDARRKLAGTVLMNFGAFLEERWRKNDILWGRLDGAERLITALMPAYNDADEALRDDLIREAHLAILAENLQVNEVRQIRKVLADCLAEQAPAVAEKEAQLRAQLAAVRAVLDRKKAELPLAMQTVLDACLRDEGELLMFYKDAYNVDRGVNAQNAVRLIARGTHVAARMFEGLALDYRVNQKPFKWLATFASIFWGIVEVAVPQSMANLFWRHWVKVLYLLDAGFILGGVLLGDDQVTRFGWIALAITLALHLAVLAMGDVIAGARKAWLRVTQAVFGLALIALLATGGLIRLYEWAFGPIDRELLWERLGTSAVAAVALVLVGALITLGVLFGTAIFQAIGRSRRKKATPGA